MIHGPSSYQPGHSHSRTVDAVPEIPVPLSLRQRQHELLLELSLPIAANAEEPTLEQLVRARSVLCERAMEVTKDFFHSVTGSDDYFVRNVGSDLSWALTELTTNELYHGMLGLSSQEMWGLKASTADFASHYPNRDRQEVHEEVLAKIHERVHETGQTKIISVKLETGKLPTGESFIELSVGAPRSFDLAGAFAHLEAQSKAIDSLFSEGKTDEALAQLETPWGRGLSVARVKFTRNGNSIRQEPPITGPVIVRKILPDT